MNPRDPQENPQTSRDYHWEPGQNPFFTEPTPNNPAPQQPGAYNTLPSATAPNMYSGQPVPPSQPATVVGAPVASPSYQRKSGPSKLVIIVIAGVVLVLVIGIIALVATSGSNKKANTKDQTSTDTTQSQSLLPAQPIDLEQTNNAISQDISGLDDEKDFPAKSLDDKTLNL